MSSRCAAVSLSLWLALSVRGLPTIAAGEPGSVDDSRLTWAGEINLYTSPK
jgi:hypothetical protein